MDDKNNDIVREHPNYIGHSPPVNVSFPLSADEEKKEPSDLLTYDYMCSRIREELGLVKLNQMAKNLGVKYRTLRLLVNDPDYKPKIDVVNDVYKKLFNWNM